ncbi:iron chelate uptake ABC transporter family permease subunit [Motilimonas pumila]|uniref:ABC transporter permease n=1 Tax=Motilimonas pumila TaxID=2303987 RepID=A0A418YB39_9GAMM|nr:iron chelate uptake ABC transporter family permease subunit [Motilimonas pumila]RJG40194.1 ABC transporter permease [Motilimonas pumila]
MANRYKFTALLLACCAVVALFIGQGLTLDNYQFFLSRRIPKLLAIILAAVCISASSLVFQTITNNRILTPSILGFDSLYLLIQALLVVLWGTSSVVIAHPIINFLISCAVMTGLALTLFHFYFSRKGNDIFTLLLLGVVLGSVFSSCANFLIMLIDPNEFTTLQAMMFASFNNVNDTLVYWVSLPLVLCLWWLLRSAATLDVLWLGPDNATSLGVNGPKMVKRCMFIITVMVAISTALVGPVLFFGLITVSLTRQVFQWHQHKYLIIASGLLAVLLLVSGQWVVEKVLGFDTTISVIINFVGGTYFLYLLYKNKV